MALLNLAITQSQIFPGFEEPTQNTVCREHECRTSARSPVYPKTSLVTTLSECASWSQAASRDGKHCYGLRAHVLPPVHARTTPRSHDTHTQALLSSRPSRDLPPRAARPTVPTPTRPNEALRPAISPIFLCVMRALAGALVRGRAAVLWPPRRRRDGPKARKARRGRRRRGSAALRRHGAPRRRTTASRAVLPRGLLRRHVRGGGAPASLSLATPTHASHSGAQDDDGFTRPSTPPAPFRPAGL